METIHIHVKGETFTIENDGYGVTTIVSTLRTDLKDDAEYNAGIDVLESMVLAMYNEGFDVEGVAMFNTLETVLTAIENNF